MRLISYGYFIFALLFPAGPASAQEVVPLERYGLAGAWLVPDTRMDRATVYLAVLAGEADNHSTEGLAHYVEHLAWLNAVGQDSSGFEQHSNATTSLTLTRYWLSGPTGDLAEMTETLAGVFAPFSLDEEFMLEERDVVLREYDLRIKENPYAPLVDDLDRRLYGTSPLSRSVIGTPEGIVSFSLAEARAFHTRTHRPGNAVVIVYGNVTPEAANAAIRGAFGAAPGEAGMRPRAYTIGEPMRDVKSVDAPDLSQPELFYRKVVELDEPVDTMRLARAALLLRDVLVSRLPGGIAKPLRYDAFIAQEFSIDIEVLDDRHIALSFFATPDKGVSLDALLAAFETALSDSAAAGIPEESLVRIRKRKLDALLSDPDPAGIVLGAAFSRTDLRHEPVDFATLLSGLESVELMRVNALLSALAGPGRVAVTLATP